MSRKPVLCADRSRRFARVDGHSFLWDRSRSGPAQRNCEVSGRDRQRQEAPQPPVALTAVPIDKKEPVAGHASSLLPAGKKWQLVRNDEFDGTTLDASKWNYRLHYWGCKSPTFTDEGVELDGRGHLKINLIGKGDDFFSAHLQTGSLTFDIPREPNARGFWPFGKKKEVKFMHKYGYDEIRCKLPRNDGWHAAFWLQSPSIGTHPNPKYCGVECDIMETRNGQVRGRGRFTTRNGGESQ